MQNSFIHSVYFWIHEGTSDQDLALFEKSVKTLLEVPGLLQAYVSKPAGTRREIIDYSYTYHLLLIFENESAHEAYQTTDTIHQKFIADCKHLWGKIQIYDSLPF